jgi:para-nitrobenzyl esterase
MAGAGAPQIVGPTMTSTAVTARLSTGLLRGSAEHGVHVFRHVPYAAPPVGPLRFARPAPVQTWAGERDASRHGPVTLQPVSRLRAAMGDFEAQQAEDCLSLTISTPGVDKRRRPVLIWLHGGAFWTGAGSIDWYAGSSLARHGDIVVVGVNYRLGAFGFLDIPGISEPNLGLHDQIAALQWVQREIEAFGGDPDNITVAGQSAGGLSVLAMLGHPASRKMIRRAVVQSAPFGRLLKTREQSQAIAQAMAGKLGITEASQWRTVSAPAINEAQLAVARSMASFANSTPAFIPVIDHELLGEDILGAALAGATDCDLMIGYTRDEMAAFFAPDEQVCTASPQQVRSVFTRVFGAAADPAMAEYRQRARGQDNAALLGEMLGDASFSAGVYGFAERLAALGRPAWVYRFDWAAPGNPFGACHCCELPFMFDTLPAWQAPMLEGGDADAMARLASQMRDAWAAFATRGDPSHPGLAHWPRYEGQRQTMLFDVQSRVAHDPAGWARWKYWP